MAETSKIYKAISQTMSDVGIVGKGDQNTFDNYKYRGIDAVMNALNPAMIKNGIFVVPTVLDISREERQGKSQTMMYTVLTVKYTFYADDGSHIESVVIGEAMDRSDKSTNKAMSAAFKYACFQTFCIPTEEMKDSEEETLEIGKPAKEPAVKEAELKAKVQGFFTRHKFDAEKLATIAKLYNINDVRDMTAEHCRHYIKKLEEKGGNIDE